MTALDGLDRLESPALWSPGDGAPQRAVYVAMGKAELVIQDPDGDTLSHWSLPALVRSNPGTLPARYLPAEGADEDLEIAEQEMVTALDRVTEAVARGRARPGALRRATGGLIAGFLTGVAILWLPGLMRDHAGNVMPAAQRADLGDDMLAELTLLTGAPCASLTGTEALTLLRQRLLPNLPLRFAVLRDLPQPALALPGGLIVLSNDVLVTQDDPDVAAGHVLATAMGATREAPLDRFLDRIGLINLTRFLSSGEIAEDAVTTHVEALLLNPPPTPKDADLRPGFDGARLAWAPFAAATGRDEGTVPPSLMPPALDDTTWQALRGICDA